MPILSLALTDRLLAQKGRRKQWILPFPVTTHHSEPSALHSVTADKDDLTKLYFYSWCWRRLLRIPWTAAYQAPLSMGFSRQEYWSGLPLQLHFHFSLSGIGEGNGNPLQCSCLENPSMAAFWRVFIINGC